MTIKEISGYCTASGATFSPRDAAEAMKRTFDVAINVGDVLNAGRWKGQQKQAEDGYARLSFDLLLKEAPTDCRWEPTLETIRRFLEVCRNAGATDLSVVCNVAYGTQCNLELDPRRLRELADLGVPIGLTCYVNTDLLETAEP